MTAAPSTTTSSRRRATGSGGSTRQSAPGDRIRRQNLELMQAIMDAQQDALNEARSAGTYDSHTISAAQKRLDQGGMTRMSEG